MFEQSFTVEETEARERLDHFLERRMAGVSRGRLRQAIIAGEVTINGEHRESGRRLRAGDRVAVRMEREPIRAMHAEPIPISVVYEDESILVVDKPSGMFAHPTSRVHSGTLLNAVLHHVEPGVRPLLVHRLDRATSGVLVLSKTPRAHNQLARAWHDRLVEKRYLALVCGRFSIREGIIDAPIGGTRDHHPGFRVMDTGKPARTRFRELRDYGPFTLVELEPLTGRTNQLRIHTAYAGAAIAGDDLHGQPEIESFRARFPDAPWPERLFLHASSLALAHPATGEPLRVAAPLPAELEEFIRRLG